MPQPTPEQRAARIRLQSLLELLNFPKILRHDMNWLRKNLGLKNSGPVYDEAMGLLTSYPLFIDV